MTLEPAPPIHPGAVLRQDYMQPRELSSNALAAHLGVTPTRINEIVREKRGITADTALRLAACFATTPEFWMDLQKKFELEVAQRTVGEKDRLVVSPLKD